MLIISLKRFSFIYMHECFAIMPVCKICVRVVLQSPETIITDDSELPFGFCKPNMSPLQKQQVIFTAESSCQWPCLLISQKSDLHICFISFLLIFCLRNSHMFMTLYIYIYIIWYMYIHIMHSDSYYSHPLFPFYLYYQPRFSYLIKKLIF